MTGLNMLPRCNVFVSLLLIQITVSAPAISSRNSGQAISLNVPTSDFDLSRANLLPVADLNGSNNGNCASSSKYKSWRTEKWNIEDCYSAVQKLYIEEVLTHPDEQFEFVDKWASSTKPELTLQRSPRKYIVSKLQPLQEFQEKGS